MTSTNQPTETQFETQCETQCETHTESSRKLGSIQMVIEVIKHPNADRLELATVLGWQVVTRIGEAQVGDKVIYCEIDGMLPGDAEWLPEAVKGRVAEQKDTSWYRIKTVKLRKELSQGLIVPISETIGHMTDYEIGTNVTDELGIKKYEPQNNLFVNVSSGIKFPSHLLAKTEESRVQSEPGLLRVLQSQTYYITVKCDGTSGTYVIDPETQELLVCSRNLVRESPVDEEGITTTPYWYIAKKYNLEEKLKEIGGYYAIQGEICGPGVQKNLMKLTDLDLFVFNVVDIRDKRLVPYPQFVKIVKELGLKTVPIEKAGDKFECDNIKELLSKAEGKYKNTKNQREGIVIRSQNQDISFKVINNRYLLKHGY